MRKFMDFILAYKYKNQAFFTQITTTISTNLRKKEHKPPHLNNCGLFVVLKMKSFRCRAGFFTNTINQTRRTILSVFLTFSKSYCFIPLAMWMRPLPGWPNWIKVQLTHSGYTLSDFINDLKTEGIYQIEMQAPQRRYQPQNWKGLTSGCTGTDFDQLKKVKNQATILHQFRALETNMCRFKSLWIWWCSWTHRCRIIDKECIYPPWHQWV